MRGHFRKGCARPVLRDARCHTLRLRWGGSQHYSRLEGLYGLVEPFERFSEAKIIEAGATRRIRHCGEPGYGTAEVAPASLST